MTLAGLYHSLQWGMVMSLLGPFSCLVRPTECHRDANGVLGSLEEAEMNSDLEAELVEELAFELTPGTDGI